MGYLLVVLGHPSVFVSEPKWAVRSAPRAAWGLVLLHASYLLLAGTTFRHVPVANVWEAFTFVAFAIAAVHVILEWRIGSRGTGVFLIAPALIFRVLSSAFVSYSGIRFARARRASGTRTGG